MNSNIKTYGATISHKSSNTRQAQHNKQVLRQVLNTYKTIVTTPFKLAYSVTVSTIKYISRVVFSYNFKRDAPIYESLYIPSSMFKTIKRTTKQSKIITISSKDIVRL